MCLENSLELLDKLGGKLLLGQVVGTFDDHRDETVVWNFAVYAFLLRFSANLAEGSGPKET